MLPKSDPWRSRKYLDRIHEILECQVGIVGVCTGFCPDGCEPAHLNQFRHGKMKASDILVAASCHACHAAIDQGADLPREERRNYLLVGLARTLEIAVKEGWLRV